MKIITVHGTNAGDDQPVGDQWWQRESSFTNELLSYLEADGEVTISTYHWSGQNDETEREKYGEILYEKIINNVDKDDASREAIYLLGHSHGGSVIEHALHLASSKANYLTEVVQWLTIGTPFIKKRFGKLKIGRFQFPFHIGYWPIAPIISFIWFGIFLRYHYFNPEKECIIEAFIKRDTFLENLQYYLGFPSYSFEESCKTFEIVGTSGLFSYIIIFFVILSLFFLVSYRKQNIFNQSKRRLRDYFGTRLVNVFARDDEAIASLKAASAARLNLSPDRPSRLLEIPFAILVAASVLLLSNYMGFLRVEMLDPNYLWKMVGSLSPSTQNSHFIDIGVSIIPFLYGTFFLISIFALSRFILIIVDRFYGRRVLNKYLNDLIAKAAMGLHAPGWQPISVGTRPDAFEEAWRELPPGIIKEIEDITNRESSITLTKLRKALSEFDVMPDLSADGLLGHLGKHLSWKELIHTAYFDAPSFAPLVAFLMTKAKGPLRASNALLRHPSYPMIKEWAEGPDNAQPGFLTLHRTSVLRRRKHRQLVDRP
ncbi:MAG: hypothetical protein AAF608_03045 [Pseudomonadota bacterium]